ncbi:hypothetical protein JQ543_24425 [Bradyrhizobium diazoefficiens]|nr:hypothetical protein [Bradyrhizobium diazoefficiens]MBR0779389.1 hypothetical protein [Bradyrhizobium diazoefficiens]MBR0850910.1 hypothetical protein [Bradyrhizobium diazoefficiens]
MKDIEIQLEKLRTEAIDCALIARLSTDVGKRELFTKLAEHYNVLAAEVQKALAGNTAKP